MYERETLDKMDVERVWLDLGLHKGFISQGHTPGTSLYYIGKQGRVGVLTEMIRTVHSLPLDLPLGDAKAAWQGPVHAKAVRESARLAFDKLVGPAKEYLNSKLPSAPVRSSKPRLKTTTIIAYEDRPDVGAGSYNMSPPQPTVPQRKKLLRLPIKGR